MCKGHIYIYIYILRAHTRQSGLRQGILDLQLGVAKHRLLFWQTRRSSTPNVDFLAWAPKNMRKALFGVK